jgi:hypothetical protein
MSDDNQIPLPASFVALHIAPGRNRPTASRAEMSERHEFCEDLATLLTEPAATRRWELGVTADDVLQRMHQGLLAGDPVVSPAEAWWVIRRLAELLGWPAPSADSDHGPCPTPDGRPSA